MKNKIIIFSLLVGTGYLLNLFLKKAGWENLFDFDLQEDIDVQEE